MSTGRHFYLSFGLHQLLREKSVSVVDKVHQLVSSRVCLLFAAGWSDLELLLKKRSFLLANESDRTEPEQQVVNCKTNNEIKAAAEQRGTAELVKSLGGFIIR